LSRAHISYNRDAHPNVTRRKGTKRTDQKANRRGPIFENNEQNKNDYCDGTDGDHLAIQIRLCPLLNRAGDLSHPLITRGRTNHYANQNECGHETDYSAHHREWHARVEDR
jgi:hypothetical protein